VITGNSNAGQLPALATRVFRERRRTTVDPTANVNGSRIAALFTSSPAVAPRDGLVWIGHETLWAVDIFSRLLVSVLVLRAVTKLTSEWIFPRALWDQSDAILKGFSGAEEPPPVGERPRLILDMPGGWKLYQHRQVYQGQLAPCPLLRPEPCATCEWFIPGEDGRDYCTAIVKLRTMHNDSFRTADLYDIRDAVIRQYGDRRRPSGPATNPNRTGPGCTD